MRVIAVLTLLTVIILFILLLILADLINTKKEVMKMRKAIEELKQVLEQQLKKPKG
ncbi:hypothetical protein [Bacillus sp. T33-2]|uniref:hypothetical protein n=1 Tax=Bacillus sp. T33-2 TaxID=2054168 RepID=UPI0015E06AB1|nr:hypothetical protein [Bacillus sp. T33-2]